MVEKINISYSEDKTKLFLEVFLKNIVKMKHQFILQDAISYLEENKIRYLYPLNNIVISNVSDRKRIGKFVFLVKKNNSEEESSEITKLKKNKK